MLQALSSVVERLRASAMAIPVALIGAALMLGVNELAYMSARSQLHKAIELGRSRVLMLQTLQLTVAAESGKRGYLLTGGKEYLQPYLAARQAVLNDLQVLNQRYSADGDAKAQQLLRDLEATTRSKLSEMDEVVRLYDEGRSEAALDVVRSGIGRDVMTQLHAQSDALLAHQNQVIASRLDGMFDTMLLNRVGIGTMTIVALLAVVMIVRVGRQLDRQRAERQAEVLAERDRLEVEVARRTSELTELARHLQTAREDERARLARDLHDELGALLTAAKLDVARIRPKLQQGAPELMDRLAHLTESLNSGIALKRRIIEDLRPSTLSSLGLVPSIEILCSEFSDRSGLKVHAHLEKASLTPSADLTVYRLVQEALTNVAKYARATQVEVRIKPIEDRVEVSVGDDGVGFDPQATPRGTHGLLGMRFRVEAEQGIFMLVSRPGEGTTVKAWVPMAGTHQPAPANPDVPPAAPAAGTQA